MHPLRAESVAWVTERKDVLSGLFCMLTLAAYVGYVRHPLSLGRYLAVMVFFPLGLLAKPILVTLPLVLLLLDYWPLGRLFENPRLAPSLPPGKEGALPSGTSLLATLRRWFPFRWARLQRRFRCCLWRRRLVR